MSDPTAADRLMTGKSWEEFCDTLKSAGRTILAEGSPERTRLIALVLWIGPCADDARTRSEPRQRATDALQTLTVLDD